MIASHRRHVETSAIRRDSYAPEMPDALSLREDKSFDGAREASRCSSRSPHGRTTTVSSMKRDTMSAAGGSALSVDRSAPNIGLFVFIRVPDVLTVIRAERSVWTRRSLRYLGLPRIPLVSRLATELVSRRDCLSKCRCKRFDVHRFSRSEMNSEKSNAFVNVFFAYSSNQGVRSTLINFFINSFLHNPRAC